MDTKTAIITGASSGIGSAIARHLYKLGYHVGLIARDEQKLKLFKHALLAESETELREPPIILVADVCDEIAIQQAIDNFIEATGKLTVLVNNAGTLKQGTTELASRDFQQLMNTNVLGVFHCIRAAAPYFKKQKSGYIFNIASTAGKLGFANLGGYSASKHAVVGLGQSVMKELIHHGVKVTTLCPNLIATEMTKEVTHLSREKMIPVIDIAQTIEFLLSLSPYTTVPEINLDCSVLI